MLPAFINVTYHTSNLKNSNLRKDPSLTLFGTSRSFPKRLVILLLKYLSNPATSHIVSITNSLTFIFFLASGKRLLPDSPELTFLFLQSLSFYSQICHLKMHIIHNFIQPSSLLNTLQEFPFSLGMKPKNSIGLSYATRLVLACLFILLSCCSTFTLCIPALSF